MCGIAGLVTFDGAPVAPHRVRAMTDLLRHRGPDDEGFHFGPGVGLGMRRLSIIDLATGHQPISDESGDLQVVLNGEIYNFRSLRRELEQRGHRFASATDTEVIVHLYEELGARCVERLRGMFAFALWDRRRRRLLLARDRAGIKPLYYARVRGGLAFASELKALLSLPELERRLDWQAVAHLFSFLTTPADRSIVEGVSKLEPGHLLEVSAAGDVAVRRYWRLEFEPDERPSADEWGESLRSALLEAVDLHRVSDVPIGAFLSGGVDSSAVVAAFARLSPRPIRTFSVGFREAAYDELPWARVVAREYGTLAREAVVEPAVAGLLDRIAWHLDEPFGDSSAIPTWVVSELAAREATVVLSGDGGDELFAGYDRYRIERRERANRFLPRPLRRLLGAVGEALPEGATGRELLRHLARVGLDRYLDSGRLFKSDQLERLFEPEAWRQVAAHDPGSAARRCLEGFRGHWLSALQRLDFESYLPLDVLTKVDRMSMAHSIETRLPLLDHPFVELAARIPPRLLLRGRRSKYVFKRALAEWLPRGVLERPKRGFAVPLGAWFRGGLSGLVEELLLSERCQRRGIFRPSYLRGLVRRHEAGRAYDLELWTLLSFELWCRTYLDAAGATVVPQAPDAAAAGSAA